MSYVIGIDIGLKNLGLAVYDFRHHKVVHWENAALVRVGKHRPKDNVKYVVDFCERYSHFFDSAFAIVIEAQMRVNMRIICAVFETLFHNYSTVHVIPPRQVKAHYDLSRGSYNANKAASVAWVRKWLTANSHVVLRTCQANWSRAKKQDDLADALLLVLFYLDTFSNQLTSHDERRVALLDLTGDELA